MVKSVSCSCVRGSRLLLNLVTHTHIHTQTHRQTWKQILNDVRAFRLTHFLSYSSSKQQKLDEMHTATHRLVPILCQAMKKYQT